MVLSTKKLFGTNGIRLIPKNFDDLIFILEVSECIGTYFQKGEVLVGRDGRNSSPVLFDISCSGLMETGIDVLEAGLVPTPALQLFVRNNKLRGGLMITASHNPPEYSGLKVVGDNGVELPRDEEEKIEKIYFEKNIKLADWRSVGTSREEKSVVNEYIDCIIGKVNSDKINKRNFKIVMDLGNGAQCVAAPYMAEELGCKVITINSIIDGSFPGRGPEPTPYVLDELSSAVVASDADLGVAYDGDGDRAIFCDDKGKILFGDQSGAILADYIASRNKGVTIVTPVSTSQVIEEIAEKRNAKVIRTKVGSVDVSDTILRENALIGFEENGGFIYSPHIPVRDGAMATALMLDLLSETGLPLSKIVSSKLPKLFQVKTKVNIEGSDPLKILKRIEEKINYEVDTTDGLKFFIDERTWVLIRPSGTEPIIRIFAESDSTNKVNKIAQKFVKLVEELK